MAKRTESTALALQGGPLKVAASQVITMAKVLLPYEPWKKIKVLVPEKIGEASAVLVAVRELVDTAETGRKQLTAPLLDRKKEIDKVYKAFVEQCAKLDDHVSDLLVMAQSMERMRLAKAAEKDAKKLEKAGAPQAAQDVREQALTAPVIGGAGITTYTTITAKVVDLKALCLAIGEGRMSVDLVDPCIGKLSALIRAGMTVPGVERVETTDVKRTA